MKLSYELKFKTTGFPWKTFDTYKSKDCPELKMYHQKLSNLKFNESVKVVEIKTTRKEVEIN
jgi:hypothetical protein